MKRKLFLRELFLAALPACATMAVVMLGARGAEHVVEQARRVELRDGFDIVAAILLLGSAFVAGERAFSRDVLERRLLFLSSLPVDRVALWGVLLAARALAALAAVAVGLALRPWMLRGLAVPEVAVMMAPLFVALLGLGSCIVLLCRGVVATYLVGGLVACAVTPPLFVAAELPSIPAWATQMFVRSESFPYADLGPEQASALAGVSLRLAAELGFLGLAAAGLSAFLFRRGELLLPRRRLAGAGLFAGVALGGVALVTQTIALPAVVRALEPQAWRVAQIQPSADGSHVLILESASQPQLARLSILAASDGAVLRKDDLSGALGAGWAPGPPAVDLAWRDDRPGYRSLRGGAARVERSDLGGRVLRRWSFPGVDALWLGGDRTLVLGWVGDEAVLTDLDRGLLARRPAKSQLSLMEAGSRLLALLEEPNGATGGWVLSGDRLQTLEAAPYPYSRIGIALVGGRIRTFEEAAPQLLARPAAPPAQPPMDLIVPRASSEVRIFPNWFGPVWDLDGFAALYGVAIDCSQGRGRLAVWLPARRSWQELSAGLPLRPSRCTVGSPPGTRLVTATAVLEAAVAPVIDAATGVAAFAVVKEGGWRADLFDPALGAVVPLGGPDVRAAFPVAFQRVWPSRQLVGLARMATEGGCRAVRWSYLPGSGVVRALGSGPCELLPGDRRLLPDAWQPSRWRPLGASGDLLAWGDDETLYATAANGSVRWSRRSDLARILARQE